MSSVLYDEMRNHLAIRERELAPSSFAVSRRVLLSFDQHLEERKKREKSITEDDVFTWLQPKYATLARGTIAPQVCCLRKFSEYLQQQGISAYVPPNTKVPDSYVPYLFSEAEIQRIFEEVDSMRFASGGNLRLELPMLLRMLYCCGFRLSELLAVRIGDINVECGLSDNTVRLYKAAFRLLLTFIFETNGVSAEKLAFQMMDYTTILAFLNWLETERNCSAATRNVRLAALSSFAAYAQQTEHRCGARFSDSSEKNFCKKDRK